MRGLNARQKKDVERIADQRLKLDQAATERIVRRMAKVSDEIGRVLGILVDRQGRIQSVTVGDNRRLYLPDIGRTRGGRGRFRGIRLIRTDFDGGSTPPRGMRDIADLPLLTEAMLRRGYSEERIRKFLGGNLLRVFRQVTQGE